MTAAGGKDRTMTHQPACESTIRQLRARHLESGEFLDYFRDGVNGLGIGEQAAGDGCDDVEGALHKFPWVRPVQLPGAEHALDAIPGDA